MLPLRTIEQWVTELTSDVDDAKASDEFQDWLGTQSRFHDYSHRNMHLIKQQCPHATKAAGYRTWQEEFDRHVDEGETAIWIWAPIIAKQCPKCENAPSQFGRRFSTPQPSAPTVEQQSPKTLKEHPTNPRNVTATASTTSRVGTASRWGVENSQTTEQATHTSLQMRRRR